MQKKHLVHVTSSLKQGGAEKVLFDLICATADEFEHSVIYIHAGPYEKRLTERGVSVYRVRGLLFTSDPWLLVQLFFLVRRLKPDLMHSLLFLANNAARVVAHILKVPLVGVIHNNIEQNGALRNSIDSLTLAYAQTVVAVSPEVAQGVTYLRPQIRVQVIHNGVDSTAIQLQAQTEKKTRHGLGYAANDFIIGSVGRFEAVKRYDLLMQTFALVAKKFSSARLLLVGYGTQEKTLKEQAERLGISEKVVFIVGQPAWGYYPLFDCFVQSSDKEGVSMALLEALCCRVPCVVMGVEKHPVITHRETGIIAPVGCSEGLFMAITELIANPALKQQLGSQGGFLVEKEFDQKAMVVAYKKVFANCLIDTK